MNKEKVIKFLKNPFNILFIILLIVTTIIYFKYQFVESIWLDETHYTWEAQLVKENPLHLFAIDAYHLPILIISFLNIFFSSFIAGRLMGLIFSIGALILVYVIGKKFRNGFIGFTAAFLLAYYHWWRFLTAKALVDIPTATLILLYAYLLYLFDKNKNWKRLLILIVIGFFTLTIKVTGLMIIPLTIVYFFTNYISKINKIKKEELWIKVKNFLKKKKNIIIIAVAVIILILLNVLIRILVNIVINYLKSFQLAKTIPTLEIVINELGWFIIIFALIGTITALFYKSKEFITIILTYGLFLFFAVFFYSKIPEIRYLFPLFPPIYLIAAYGIDEIINYVRMFIITPKLSKYAKLGLRIIALLIIFFIVIKPYYALGNQIIENKNYAYTGYIEAMDWVSDNIKTKEGYYIPNFFACCSYNVGLDRNDVRRVNWSGRFETFEEFRSFIERGDNINKTMYLMPDMWEPGQREWLYPMTKDKYDNFVSLGFNLIYVVERPYPTRESIKKIPVIFIFRRN